MLGRHAFLRLEILSEEGGVREIEPIDNLLDGHLRMAQHTLNFLDGFLPYPFGRGFAAGSLYHGGQVLGGDTHLGNIECHASFPTVMHEQQVPEPCIQGILRRLVEARDFGEMIDARQ